MTTIFHESGWNFLFELVEKTLIFNEVEFSILLSLSNFETILKLDVFDVGSIYTTGTSTFPMFWKGSLRMSENINLKAYVQAELKDIRSQRSDKLLFLYFVQFSKQR